MLFKFNLSCIIAFKKMKVIWPPKKNPALLGLNLQPLDFKMIFGPMFYHYTIQTYVLDEEIYIKNGVWRQWLFL